MSTYEWLCNYDYTDLLEDAIEDLQIELFDSPYAPKAPKGKKKPLTGIKLEQARFQAKIDANKWAKQYQVYDPTKPLSATNVLYREVGADKRVEFLRFMSKVQVVALDTETTGFNYNSDNIISVQFSRKAHESFLIRWEDIINDDKVRIAFIEFLYSKNIIALHNVKFDLQFICRKLWPDDYESREIELIGKMRDTAILAYIILGTPTRKDGGNLKLKALVRRLLKMDMRDYDDLGGLDLNTPGGFVYAVRDTDATIQLYYHLMLECPEDLTTIIEIEHKATIGTIHLERNGVQLIPEFIRSYKARMLKMMAELQEEFYQTVPRDVEIGSSAQLAKFYFGTCKIPVPEGSLTDTGKPSIAKGTLVIIQDKHPSVTPLLAWKKLAKLVSTYTDALLAKMNSETLILVYRMMQLGTETGRYSSSSPNLQNIPKFPVESSEPDDEKFIKAFREINFRTVIRPRKGYRYIKIDFKAQEIVVTAILSKDPVLRKLIIEGHDLHAAFAIKCFKLKDNDGNELDPFNKKHQKFVKENRKAFRGTAKTVLFALLYGASKYRVFGVLMTQERWQEFFALDEDARAVYRSDMLAMAQQIIDDFFDMFKDIKKYHNYLIAATGRKGYVTTLLGRRRKLDVHYDKGWKRKAVNTPIQGTCGDVMKVILPKVIIAIRSYDARVVLSVHDELVLEVAVDQLDTVEPLVIDIMRHNIGDYVKLDMDLDVDSDRCVTWGWTEKAVDRYMRLMNERGNIQEIRELEGILDYQMKVAV